MNSFSPGAPKSWRGEQGFGKSVRGQGGFAYLWTLLLVAFMGVGLVIVSEVYSTSLQRERERELIFIGREFRNAIGRFYESPTSGGQRQYPAALEDLLKDPRFPNGRRYLRRIYIDPMTGEDAWGLIRVNGRIVGVHSLSDKTPIKQDNFDTTEAVFRGKAKYSEWSFTYPPDLLLSATGHPNAPGSLIDHIRDDKPGTVINKDISAPLKNIK